MRGNSAGGPWRGGSTARNPVERLMSSLSDEPKPDEPKPPEGEAAAAPAAPAEEPPRVRHTIGALLRETRENYGGDIERIAGALRIRPAYLTALEEGRYDRLPAPVYALGFVRAYAIHLGLDGEEAVRRFKQEANGLEISRDLIFPVPLAERSIPHKPILITAALLLLVAYASWYYLSSSGSRERPERVSEVPADLVPDQANNANAANPPAEPPAAAASISSAPRQSAPPAPAPQPQAAAPPANPSPPQLQAAAPPSSAGDSDHVFGTVGSPVRIVIRANADSWLQVRDRDQSTLFQRLMKANDIYRVPDRPGLSFMTGNASALDITVDDKPAPPLSGAVRHTILLDPARLMAGTAAVD